MVRPTSSVAALPVRLAFPAFALLASPAAFAQMELHGHRQPASHAEHESEGFTFHIRQVAGYNRQGGPRGATAGSSENFQMMVYRGSFGPINVEPHIMTTLEPWTLPKGGAPQLFQAGETYDDKPLLDRQHPHDVWMEITEKIIFPLGGKGSGVFVQGGPVGSPALGPDPFMHRASARHLPWAPLGHHYQDSTHVSMGVLNAGVRVDIVEAELSQFNGREPDENRTKIDKGKMDSWSTRITLHLWEGLKAQTSTGVLKSPEVLEPGDQRRTTASLHWQSGDKGSFQHATSFIFGSTQRLANEDFNASLEPDADQGDGEAFPVNRSWLAETDLTWGDGLFFYGRFESVDKHGLDLKDKGGESDETVHRINALTLGSFLEVSALSNKILTTGLGADVTLHYVDKDVQKDYGSMPMGNHLFVMAEATW
ncbi:MAG: hypothetical protein RIQ81_1462 [Pseudomonadota bacterium]|jgi:hypothetical protein